jgi:hypothetical protein
MTPEPRERVRWASLQGSAIALVLFLAIHFTIHWYAGTFDSEFGRYPDEGMHYVTGLMIRDFITSPADWDNPMAFAINYYSHFPKVALGNWPPGFALLQAVWTLMFGVSRLSLLLEMSLLTAVLALVVFSASVARAGPLFALLGGALLVASPLTQYVASMTMSEIALALFSFLSVLAWIHFVETGRTRDALLFGALTLAAIMTKGDAWVIPVVAGVSILMTRSWALLRNGGLWLAALLVAAICVPYTLFTMGIVVQGWNTSAPPGVAFLLASLGVHARFAGAVLGIPVTGMALVGLAGHVLVPLWRRERPEFFWLTLALYGCAVMVFHAVVPTSIEPRKIYQIAPVISVLAAVGLADVARLLARRRSERATRVGVAVAALAAFVVSGFALLPSFAPGFVAAVATLLARPDTDGAAVLISSNPVFADSEAAIIAEWAARRRTSGTYLVRGTKLLSYPVSNNAGMTEFEPYSPTAQDLQKQLAAVPVAYVVLHTTPAARSYGHHDLLHQTVEGHTEDWERIYSSHHVALGEPHDIAIYRSRKDLRGVPVHLEIDLTEKIQQKLEIGTGRPAPAR